MESYLNVEILGELFTVLGSDANKDCALMECFIELELTGGWLSITLIWRLLQQGRKSLRLEIVL